MSCQCRTFGGAVHGLRCLIVGLGFANCAIETSVCRGAGGLRACVSDLWESAHGLYGEDIFYFSETQPQGVAFINPDAMNCTHISEKSGIAMTEPFAVDYFYMYLRQSIIGSRLTSASIHSE